MIISNADRMMNFMGQAPYDFVMNHSHIDLEKLHPFVHRTFNGDDFVAFIKSLKYIYSLHGGLEAVFTNHQGQNSMQEAISLFKQLFFESHILQEVKNIYQILIEVPPLNALICSLDGW